MSKINRKKVKQTQKDYNANKDKQYVVKEITDVRFNTITQVKQYKVQWEFCQGKIWAPTWEPQQFLTKISLLQFYTQKKKKKQQKQKIQQKKKKTNEQKMIREYQSRINAEIQDFQKRKGVSYQKMKQIRQNRNRAYQKVYDKQQSSLDHKNDQSKKSTNNQQFDFLIDRIVGSQQVGNEEYYQVWTVKPHSQRFYISQFNLVKYFPDAFMKYLEKEQVVANQNFLKYRKPQINQIDEQNQVFENQFQLQKQKARNQNRCMVSIQDGSQIKIKFSNKEQLSKIDKTQNISNKYSSSISTNKKVAGFSKNKKQSPEKIQIKDQATSSKVSSQTQKKLNISADTKSNLNKKKTNNQAQFQKGDKQDYNSMFQAEKDQNLYYSDED